MATIAVDFDGTIVTHEYPKIGTELPFATETFKVSVANGNSVPISRWVKYKRLLRRNTGGAADKKISQ